MNALLLSLGVVAVAGGVYSVARPLSVRNWVAAEEWDRNPEQAREKQRQYARLMGTFLVGLGIALALLGLFPG
ncbi:hypothetical protein [Haloarcula litorea]|uniref:hypothetical protein n=1 Tax=Haloarcula litorea TaxID=3032579 RepID=UPI0023E87DDC|nr:hypothetical protein [Halomicroarcula sp. GDY20]